MNVRRVLQVGAIGLWGLALAPVVAGTSGQAESGPRLDAYGWWNKTQALPVQGNPLGVDDPSGNGLTTAPTVPAPATVPEDGLYVANDASGPTAIAALRFLVGQAGGTLTLRLPEDSTATGTEAVVACPVQGGFTAVANGRWDAKPAYDESACIVEGRPSADGASITFDVPATFASSLGDVSVVIVPAVGSTTPFSLPLASPSNDSFTVTTPAVTPTPQPAPAPAYEPGSPVYTAPVAPPAFAAPASPGVVTTVDTAGEEVAAGSGAPAATSPVTSTSDAGRASRLMAVGLLAAIGMALWWLTSQPQRAPRLLGSVGGSAPAEVPVAAPVRAVRARGVGRFARQRDVPATPL